MLNSSLWQSICDRLWSCCYSAAGARSCLEGTSSAMRQSRRKSALVGDPVCLSLPTNNSWRSSVNVGICGECKRTQTRLRSRQHTIEAKVIAWSSFAVYDLLFIQKDRQVIIDKPRHIHRYFCRSLENKACKIRISRHQGRKQVCRIRQ